MPRRRRVPKHRADVLTDRQRDLLTENFDFGPAFGRGFESDAERQVAWELHRAELLSEFIAQKPGQRPWAWWRFEAPEPRDPAETEPEQLARLGVLTDQERAVGARR